jgi:hypothetical protein
MDHFLKIGDKISQGHKSYSRDYPRKSGTNGYFNLTGMRFDGGVD